MKSRCLAWLIVAFVFALIITGCGGSGSSPNPPAQISVSFSPQPPSSLDAGTSSNLTAAVSNDSANAGVTWAVTCSAAPCGTFSAASTASGAATKYSAPTPATKSATVTVTATAVSDTTKSASATITISAPSAPISVALTTPPASVAATKTAAFTATVSNDSANAGVTWTVTCGSAQCGSFSPASTPSATATTFTAPAAPPTPATITVTATSVSDTTKSASASIAITAAPPVLADGNYVFHVAGNDGTTTPYFVAGAFTVQNGAISAGEQDMTDDTITVQDQILPAQSTLSAANGNIQIVLNTNDTAIGVNGIETFRGAVVSNARVLIEEFDTFATAAGSVDAQTSTSAPAGGYAFNLGGYDGSSNPSWLAIGGILNVSGSSISVANSVLDYNDGGNVAQRQSFASGNVGAPDAFGRVVFTLTPSGSGLPSFAVAGYTVSASQIQLVETADTLSGDLGGAALGQASNTGTFNQASVAGNSYAFGANGQDNTTQGTQFVQLAGGLGLNSDGTVGGAIALNDLNFHFGSNVTSGNYTVDPTGRVTVTATVTSGSLENNPTFTFQLYLDGNGNALELGVDSLQSTSGLSFVQQAPSSGFEGNYAANVYGYSGIHNEPAWSAAGPVSVVSDTFTGYTDYSLQNATNSASAVTPGIALTGSENSSTGLLTLQGLYSGDLPGPPQTNSGFGYYPIDSERVLAIEIDSQQMGLMMLEGVQPTN
jgi:hypothetical protein